MNHPMCKGTIFCLEIGFQPTWVMNPWLALSKVIPMDTKSINAVATELVPHFEATPQRGYPSLPWP
jgi:hypothetical protein